MLQRVETAATLAGTQASRAFFERCLQAGDDEVLFVAHVDDSARCIHLACYEGEGRSVDLPLRSIIADAALHGTTGLVLAHNHPGGDPKPSSADARATRRLATAAEALDVTVLDHMIFAGQQCCSMRRMGLL
jgi:DNA repair protein RadC